MFDWLREIADIVKAEIDIATANPSEEMVASMRRALHNEDAEMCAAIEDSSNHLIHGRILGDMEVAGLTINDPVDHIAKTIGWSEQEVRETVEAEKIVLFLKQKLYDKDQIIRIGNISLSLQRNGGDVKETAVECGADIDSVNAVIQLLNEYAASVGGTVIWSTYVGGPTETPQQTESTTTAVATTKSSTKKSGGSKSSSANAKKENGNTKPFQVAVTTP